MVNSAAGTTVGRVSFVGGGFMGEGILQGLLSRGIVQSSEVGICELVDARRQYLADRYGVNATAHVDDAVRDARVIVLAVKPQDFDAVARQLGPSLHPEQVVLSIMAGVTITAMRSQLMHERVVRAMPNTPGAIGEGFSAWTASAAVNEDELAAVRTVLEALGKSAFFPEEKYLDVATAVSGSGPAYVLLLMEAMVDAAVLAGIRRDIAIEMVLQTFAGTVKYAQATGRHFADLRNAVTSPGGTTAAGLQVLERAGIRGVIADAVWAAYERSKALGG